MSFYSLKIRFHGPIPITCPSIFGAVLLVCLLSCTHPNSSDLPRPALEMPSRWQAAAASKESNADLEWLSYFDDPQLYELVAEALSQNYDLGIAATYIADARIAARFSAASRRPSLDLGITAQRGETPIELFDQVRSVKQTNYQTALNLSWELDLWNRLKNQHDAANRELVAAKEDWQAVRLSLAGQVAKAWYQVMADHWQTDLVKRTLTSYQTHTHLVRQRFQRGISSALDLRLMRSNVAVARALLQTNIQQLNKTKRHLQQLLQRYPDGKIHIPIRLPTHRQAIPAGLPSQLLQRRPDIRAARQRLEAADLRISMARKAYLPQIRLTGELGRTSEALHRVLDPDYYFWNLIGNMTQPIFQSGRLKANLETAQTAMQRYWLTYARTVFTAFSEVEAFLTTAQFLNRRQMAVQETVNQALAAERLALKAYAGGVGEMVAVLEAQRRSLDARITLIDIHRQQHQNRVDLYLALGGGFRDPVE